ERVERLDRALVVQDRLFARALAVAVGGHRILLGGGWTIEDRGRCVKDVRHGCAKLPRVTPCRFAPTTSGPAHPGTLLAGLLAWLDARSREARFTLRLEDVDPERCTPESADDMRAALHWFGLDWDAEELQSHHRPAHEAALDRLAEAGLLYPCTCTRSEIARAGTRAADGGGRHSARGPGQPPPARR